MNAGWKKLIIAPRRVIKQGSSIGPKIVNASAGGGPLLLVSSKNGRKSLSNSSFQVKTAIMSAYPWAGTTSCKLGNSHFVAVLRIYRRLQRWHGSDSSIGLEFLALFRTGLELW